MKRASKRLGVAAAAAVLLLAAGRCATTRTSSVGAGPAAPCGKGAWSSAAPLSSPHHQASLLVLDDGRVLRAGGYEGSAPSEQVDLYDPRLDAWQPLPPMHHGRVSPALVQATDGRVFAFGGTEPSWERQAVEVLDASLSSWRVAGAPLDLTVKSAKRRSDGSIVLGGESEAAVVRRGGSYKTSMIVATAAELDPTSFALTRRLQGTTPRYRSTPLVLERGEVAIIGGEDLGGKPWPGRWAEIIRWPPRRAHRDVELTDLATPFQRSASAPRDFDICDGAAVVEVAPRQLLVVGPRDDRTLAYRFDLDKDRARGVASPQARGDGAALVALSDGSVLLVGGSLAPTATECFDPARSSWTTLPDAPSKPAWRAGVMLHDGRALFVGDTTRVDVFNP